MSTTRRADSSAPLCQWRYMSSPEFKDMQAISATAVAKRCALLASSAKQKLVWFIQGLSLPENGGLKKLAAELVEMFPERIVEVNKSELGERSFDLEKATRKDCINFAIGKTARPDWSEVESYDVWRAGKTLEEFLIDLCVNPALLIRLRKDGLDGSDFDAESVLNKYPQLKERDLVEASLPYFRDVIGALIEYKRRYEESARARFCQTAISKQIWKQLDELHSLRVMGLIDGLEGRGKTEAARAWCQCHLGVARFMSMKGTDNKTAHFREMARALGVGYGSSRKSTEMQAGVEEVLRVSKLMPVIDEAHYFFNQSQRLYSRPEMLDWIDTALCNPPSPVALVTTPQFMVCMERAAGQVGWNYRQFKRRCKRLVRLPEKNTAADIESVARHLVPKADKATIKAIVAYEALSGRDLSAVGDAAREAKLLAEQEGAKHVTFAHMKRAIYDVLMPSDLPWAEMERRIESLPKVQRPRRAAMPDAEAETTPEAAPVAPETQARGTNPGPALEAPERNRLHFSDREVLLQSNPHDGLRPV